MTDYYDHTTFPVTGGAGSSADMRAELISIESGFAKLPALVGNSNKLVRVNTAETAQVPSLIEDDGVNVTINGSIISTGGITLGTTLAIADGGTGAITAPLARVSLGVDIGVDVQAHSAVLDATTASFLIADETKLDGIETLATADQTGAEIKTLYEAESNAFTDAQFTKLAGIETLATADQTGVEIKAAYELEANAFTDAQFTKLSNIETLADVTDATNVAAAGALMASNDLSDVTTPATALNNIGGSSVAEINSIALKKVLVFG